MGKRRLTPAEIKAMIMQESLNRQRSAEEILELGRKTKTDRNIQLGHNIAFGLALIELMEAYEWDAEEIINFAKLHEEYLATYESDSKEDKQYTWDLFKKLKEKTGYSVLCGSVESEVKE